MTKRIKFIAALMSLASAMFLAQPQAHAAVAPLNPDYVKYMERAEGVRPAARSLAANSTEQQQNHPVGGYVPSPLNWSHLDGKTWSLPRAAETEGEFARARSAANAPEALPSRYDLREIGEVTPVRDQTAFNNCWTYSGMAATESNLLKKGLADAAALDLSEWYLTYYALNPYGGMECFTNPYGDPYYLVGGNDWKAVALLSRGTGSVTTAKAPDITSYYEYDHATGAATYEDYSQVYAPAAAARDYKLVNALYLGNFGPGENGENELWEVPLAAGRREMIKRAIMQYGAVSAGIHMTNMRDDYNSETGAYYSGLTYYRDDPKNGVWTNHAVAIVGWDDDYPITNFAEGRQPRSNGAWIVRNSWGEGFGDGGYFYVSYEEGTLCDGVAYDSEPARSGENVYQYDPLGCVIWYYPGYDYSSRTLYFANLFTAQSDDSISSVAFYVPDDGMRYEISVYTDCGADSPVSGTPASDTTSVDSLVPGYNTVTLTKPVEVAAGTRFSVVVKAVAAEDGYDLLAPVENIGWTTGNASANPGEGWISIDGENFYDIIELLEDEGVPGTNPSLCLKAFGERIYSASDTPAPVITGEAAVSGGGSVSAFVSAIPDDANETEQTNVIAALGEESVEGVAPSENVALLGSFRMDVEHSGGSATFAIKLAEPMSFEGTPYVIIRNNKSDGVYRAFRAEYGGDTLSFTVDRLEDYFSEALITIADVKASAQPARHGGSGGCSAGFGALALLALVPLALATRKK